jgi:hypothetical protein
MRQGAAYARHVNPRVFLLTYSAKTVLIEKGDGEVFAGFAGQALSPPGCKAGTNSGRPAGVPASLVFSLLIVLFLVSLVLSIR